VSNVSSEEKKQQVIALGRLGWSLRRIQEATHIRRETASAYLKAAGIVVRPPGGWGRGRVEPVDPAAKPAIQVATGPGPRQGPPKPARSSNCEPHREFIEQALARGRNGMAIWQDLVALLVLGLRDRIIFLLAVLVGMRPGEILALRWARADSKMIEIAQSVYRGLLDDLKTERGKRQAAFSPDLASEVDSWRNISSDTGPDALVFPSERGTYLSRDNFLRRNIQKKLEEIGLGWVNFQVLRRTQASVGNNEGVGPKVAADQRGHAIGVAIDTYTESDLESRREAVAKLELALAGRKPADRAAAADSSSKPGFRGKTG
jgi:hypothetical protein